MKDGRATQTHLLAIHAPLVHTPLTRILVHVQRDVLCLFVVSFWLCVEMTREVHPHLFVVSVFTALDSEAVLRVLSDAPLHVVRRRRRAVLSARRVRRSQANVRCEAVREERGLPVEIERIEPVARFRPRELDELRL
jgi:hypothetical protein